MLIKSYSTTQLIHIIHFNEITQYTNMVIVKASLHKIIISYINEKVTKSYKFNYQLIQQQIYKTKLIILHLGQEEVTLTNPR